MLELLLVDFPFLIGGKLNVRITTGWLWCCLLISLPLSVSTQLYAQTFGSIVGFKSLSDMILLSLVNKVSEDEGKLIVSTISYHWCRNMFLPSFYPLLAVELHSP